MCMDLERMGFSNKKVVLTGAGSGIGRAIAKMFLEQGAIVYAIQNRSPAEFASYRISMNLADPQSIDQASGEIPDHFDILCNAAGLGADGNTAKDIIAVNFLGTKRLTENILDRLSPSGCLLNFGSTAGRHWRRDIDLVKVLLAMSDFEDVGPFWQPLNLPNQSAYGLSKAAVTVWSMKLANRYSQNGPRINVLSPGFTDTPMLQKAMAEGNEVIHNLAKSNHHMAQPEDVARVALFLCSAEAAVINGAEILADGGLVATGNCAEYAL
jgi:NAD(P)-dependent dehydrogenase (short-subunit alcohol dehydrogenase family)